MVQKYTKWYQKGPKLRKKGFKNGPKYNATGHFRTQKINDKWWIIDPSGCLFWSTGVNAAGILEIDTPVTKG